MYTQLLCRLISTSPIIEDHINGLRSVVANNDGSLTMNDIINEGFEIVLELLKDQGIVPHVSKSELLEDFYSASTLIDILKQYTPDNIKVYLDNNPKLYNIVKYSIDNIPPTELLVAILELDYQLNPCNSTRTIYNTLHDKLTNTVKYYEAIVDILNYDNEDKVSIVFDKEILDWLTSIREERRWVNSVISDLLNDNVLELNSEILLDLTGDKFKAEYCDTSVLSILAYNDIRRSNYDLVMNKIHDIHKKSPYYISYYSGDDIEALTTEWLVVIVLSSIVDYRLLGIPVDIDKLTAFYPDKIRSIFSIDKLRGYAK